MTKSNFFLIFAAVAVAISGNIQAKQAKETIKSNTHISQYFTFRKYFFRDGGYAGTGGLAAEIAQLRITGISYQLKSIKDKQGAILQPCQSADWVTKRNRCNDRIVIFFETDAPLSWQEYEIFEKNQISVFECTTVPVSGIGSLTIAHPVCCQILLNNEKTFFGAQKSLKIYVQAAGGFRDYQTYFMSDHGRVALLLDCNDNITAILSYVQNAQDVLKAFGS